MRSKRSCYKLPSSYRIKPRSCGYVYFLMVQMAKSRELRTADAMRSSRRWPIDRIGNAQFRNNGVPTDVIRSAITQSGPSEHDSAQNLRTGRRVSHVLVIDTPRYPRLLLVADAAVLVARKTVRFNLSDLAAKGARPRAYLSRGRIPSQRCY
jgi:hypothetical protein